MMTSEGCYCLILYLDNFEGASTMAQIVKNLCVMEQIHIQALNVEKIPLRRANVIWALHILVWRIP